MNAWRTALQKSLDANQHLKYSKFMQLATTRPDGRPAVRTIVYRGFLDGKDDVLTFNTDLRTAKVEDLRNKSSAEICWYFPESREQYRLGGEMSIVGPDHPDEGLLEERQKSWAEQSTGGRAWYVWPASGERKAPEEEFDKPVPDGDETADPNFALVLVDVEYVDYVLLPKVRVRHTLATPGDKRSWQAVDINP